MKRSTLELMQITLHNSEHMGLYKQTGAELCKLYMDLDINHEVETVRETAVNCLKSYFRR